MSLRVFAADANPCVDAFLYRQSNLRGEEIVSSGRGTFITLADGRRAVQLLPLKPKDAFEREIREVFRESAALLPIYRCQNPLIAPEKLHYEIPMANDLGLRRHNLRRRFDEDTNRGWLESRTIKVSARNGKRIIAAAFEVPTGVLTNSTSLLAASPMSSQLA